MNIQEKNDDNQEYTCHICKKTFIELLNHNNKDICHQCYKEILEE